MTNTMCRDGFCDYERKESEIVGSDVKSDNRVVMVGFFIIAAVVVATMWYGATQGIYVDPTYIIP